MSHQAVWVHMPVVTALGWAIVHFFWEGTLIALALAAALSVYRSARVRYGAASVAMLAMLTAFGVTLAVSIPGPETALPAARTAAAADAGATAAIAIREPTALERLQGALPWVVPFWMAGALLVGLYRLAGWMAAERVRREGVCAAPTEWQARLARLAQRIGVPKPLVLLESSLADAPLVIGLLQPVILVPAGMLAGLPPSYLEAILLHELAHIRRSDYLVNLVQTLVESLLFYHPAVWWVSAEMRTERENCCDDAVVAVEGDAGAYATALVMLEERRSAGREPALAASGGRLMLRIRRLLDQPEQPRAGAALILSLGLLLGLFCLFAAARQANSDKPDSPGKAAQRQPEAVYDKWLNEDVVYIITAEERATFERQRSDRARERFIEQFWLRRDPTPGTTENEFKDEHYRRIGFANQRFLWTGAAGWKTDRGRIYIVYGPPDEIDAHLSGGGAYAYPNEQWRYRHIEGIGDNVIVEFADPARSGEFRMTKDPREKAALKK